MKVLVINAGSSSLKCTLFEMPRRQALADGMVEKIGEGDAIMSFSAAGADVEEPCQADEHAEALQILMDRFLDADLRILSAVDEIGAVGHRVVHGGESSDSTVVTEDTLRLIRDNAVLAPLHNPPNLAGIGAALRMLPDRPQVAVFDTAFHTSMAPEAYLYALPYSLYRERHVRAYGFHGTSHRYVTSRAAGILGLPPNRINAVTLHLGNGCSATAVRNGRSVDTSMGMTPLQGLVMGTRSGDVDPGLFYFLTQWLSLAPAEVYELLNRQSGLLGLSGVSNDVREILEAAHAGNAQADVALDVFAYRVRKYIGAYFAVLGRVDGVVFTAGIGENCAELRRRICAGLQHLGVILDEARNAEAVGREAVISTEDSPTAVLVVPTNEELQIAIETYEIATREETQ